MSRLRPVALLALLFPGVVSAASAGTLVLSGAAPGGPVRAGERIAVEGPAELPGTEAELLLSLDGGRTFPLRVTPEHAPGDSRFTFRVPNLPAPGAVLALRTGEDGERETIRAVSAPFAIASEPAAPPEPVLRLGGELATREAAAGGDGGDAPLPEGLGGAAPSLAPLGEPLDAADAAALPAAYPDDAPAGLAADVPFPALGRPGAFRARISLPKRE